MKDKMRDKDENDHQEESGSRVIPVIEERLRIDKEKEVTGKYIISKKIHSEEVEEDVSVTEENVSIVRKEFNQYIDSPPPALRQEGDTTVISVVKEVLVVEKKLMLVEELHITKDIKQSTVPVKETIRKEEVNVKKSEGGT
jgi:uncharacterized protein (TIGR02271 family)